MKKNYESPIAKKLEFNYAEVVTASDTPGPSNKGWHLEEIWVGNTNPFAKCGGGCHKSWTYASNC